MPKVLSKNRAAQEQASVEACAIDEAGGVAAGRDRDRSPRDRHGVGKEDLTTAAARLEAKRIAATEALGLGSAASAAGQAASAPQDWSVGVAAADVASAGDAPPHAYQLRGLAKARAAQEEASAVVRAALEAAGATAGRDRDRSPRARASEAGSAAAGAGKAKAARATPEPFDQSKVGSAFVLLEGVGDYGDVEDAAMKGDDFQMTQGIADSSESAATALKASRVAADAAAGAEAALSSDPAAKESHAAVAQAAAAMTSASEACERAKAVQAMVTKAKSAAEARASAGL